MTKKPRTYVYKGIVEVCAHRVSFWFRGLHRINAELKQWLTQEAEERAKSQIIEGCVQGELCFMSTPAEHEYNGWWNIER